MENQSLVSNELKSLIMKELTQCGKCNNKRKEVQFKDLPYKAKKEFEELKDKSMFLYCPHCNEHSMLTLMD